MINVGLSYTALRVNWRACSVRLVSLAGCYTSSG
jgi:hypothetical protein